MEGAGGEGLIFREQFNGGYFAFTYEFGGLKFGGAYTFQNFTVFNNIIILSNISLCLHYF